MSKSGQFSLGDLFMCFAFVVQLHDSRRGLKVYKYGMSEEEFIEENKELLLSICSHLEKKHGLTYRSRHRSILEAGIRTYFDHIGVIRAAHGAMCNMDHRDKTLIDWSERAKLHEEYRTGPLAETKKK